MKPTLAGEIPVGDEQLPACDAMDNIYVVVEVYDAVVNDVYVYSREDLAESKFEEITGVEYQYYFKGIKKGYDVEYLLGKNDGTKIFVTEVQGIPSL